MNRPSTRRTRRTSFAIFLWLVLLLFIGGIAATPGSSAQPVQSAKQMTVAEIYRASIPHIFTIRTTEALGTGFSYSLSSNIIVTNAHVVGTATSVDVETQDGAKFRATVIDKNVDLDWALLRPDGIAPFLSMMPLILGDPPAIGEAIVVIGSPGGLKGTVTAGIVSQIYPDGTIQLNVAINPGNSGGPVFNMKGQVFGIATAKYKGGDGLGFAIPLTSISWR